MARPRRCGSAVAICFDRSWFVQQLAVIERQERVDSNDMPSAAQAWGSVSGEPKTRPLYGAKHPCSLLGSTLCDKNGVSVGGQSVQNSRKAAI